MTSESAPEQETDRVILTVPNDADYVALARFAAGIVAVRAGFDLEEVQDLQLAVDEMYVSSGIPQRGGIAQLEISRSDSGVSMSLTSLPSPFDSAAPQLENHHVSTELSQQLLSALVDDHGSSTDDGGTPCLWIHKSHAS
jgi:hypothetical protein